MLAVQLNLCVGAGAPSAPSSEGGEAATAAYHSITSVPHIHKMCRHGRHTFVFHAPEGRASYSFAVLHAPKARFIYGAAAKNAPRGGCFCFTAISGDFVAGLYRAFGAVMSALRAGYIFVPSGQKFRCVRRAHTF